METEVKAVVDQWVDNRSEEELDQQVVKMRSKNWRRSWPGTRPSRGAHGGGQR